MLPLWTPLFSQAHELDASEAGVKPMPINGGSTDYLYDVFISYSRRDSAWVDEALIPRLEQEGIHFCIDRLHFPIGAPIVRSIEEAIESSRKVLLVITPDWLKSEWTKFEDLLVQTDEIANRQRRILPLLLVPGQLPPRLRMRNYLDLIDPLERDEKMVRLLEELKSREGRGSPTNSYGNTEFVSGAVLCGTVVGFSTFLTGEQDRVIQFLQGKIDEFLQGHSSYWLEFHGGDFLLFLEKEANRRRQEVLEELFLLGALLQHAASTQGLSLGVTLDWEPDASWCTIAERKFLIGTGLLDAMAHMSFADEGHFLLSSGAYAGLEKLRQEANRAGFTRWLESLQRQSPIALAELAREWLAGAEKHGTRTKLSSDAFELHDWAKRPHQLYNVVVTAGEATILGKPSSPDARVKIEYRDPRERYPTQEFIQRLVEADEAYILALTHEGTVMFLQEALDIRRRQNLGFWSRVEIIFPTVSFLKGLIDQHPSPDVRLERLDEGKQGVFKFLLGQGVSSFDKWESPG
jgi:hypothetical protein